MFLRLHRNIGEHVPSTTAVISPGAHDLLATDISTRNGPTHGGRRLSVSLQVTSSDLSVGSEEFHVVQEQQ
jgi:hypothetical protein